MPKLSHFRSSWLLVAALAGFLAPPVKGQIGTLLERSQTVLDNDPQLFEWFGNGIAADREWVAVAAYADQSLSSSFLGSVSMFRRINGELSYAQEIQSSSGQATEWFASSDVDLEGDVLVASTWNYQGAASRTGRAYVYEFNTGTWLETARLEPSDPLPGGTGFGTAVAIAGGDILVSRPYLYTSQNPIYVYRKIGGAWQQIQRWMSPNESPNLSSAGYRLAADGGWVAVGGYDHGGRRVYVLERDPGGVWQLDERIAEPAPAPFTMFGAAVAIEGDLLAVGQPYWPGHEVSAGKVHLYRRGAAGWALEQTLTGSDNQIITNASGTFNDGFGLEVDIEEGRVLVGAFQTRINGRFIGQAYIFEETASGWIESYRLRTYVDDWGFPQLGIDVALTGDVAIVGAQDASQPDFRAGAAAVFRIPFGTTTCAGRPNSTGAGSILTLAGDRRVEIGDLTATVNGLPPGSAGYLLASRSTGHVPSPAGSQGDLCLGNGIARLAPPVQLADASGQAHMLVPLHAIPLGTPTPILAGETWYFQYWHRDANPSSTSNFSSARQVSFR